MHQNGSLERLPGRRQSRIVLHPTLLSLSRWVMHHTWLSCIGSYGGITFFVYDKKLDFGERTSDSAVLREVKDLALLGQSCSLETDWGSGLSAQEMY